MTDRFLVTGAAGCLGAWTLAALRDQAIEAVAFDLADDRRRLRLVEQPGRGAGVQMRSQDAGGILHRHVIAGEGHHLAAKLDMQIVEGSSQQFLVGRAQDSLRVGITGDSAITQPPSV